MIYWRRYPGDYMRDTADLSLIEHGIYAVLLDHYYSTELPLPADVKALQRLCRAQNSAEKTAVAALATRFFALNGDGLRHNKRADQEILFAQQAIAKMSDAGRLGNKLRWHRPPDSPPDHHPIAPPIQPPTTSLQPSTKSNPLSADADLAFCEFWKAYPAKKDKKKAFRAWLKIDAAELPEILGAIEREKLGDRWQRGFIPHPSTWLNGERWKDEQTSADNSVLGQCRWNVNDTRDPGKGQCPAPGTVLTGQGPYCKAHATRINA